MIFIGIDPGVNTGIAIYDSGSKKLIEAYTLSVSEFAGWLVEECAAINPDRFFVENPNLNKPVFKKRLEGKEVGTHSRISSNVGINKGIATTYIAFIEALGYVVEEVKPTKSTFTKLSSEQFKKITNYQESTSEHSRDEAMLVWGK